MSSMTFSPDGKTLVVGGSDGKIELWNVFTGENIATFGAEEGVSSMTFSPDGKTLASGLDFGEIKTLGHRDGRKYRYIGRAYQYCRFCSILTRRKNPRFRICRWDSAAMGPKTSD